MLKNKQVLCSNSTCLLSETGVFCVIIGLQGAEFYT